MMHVSSEFATPIGTSRWSLGSEHNPRIRDYLLEEADEAERSSHLPRGQEGHEGFDQLGASFQETKGISQSVTRKIKKETFDDLHLKAECCKPMFRWALMGLSKLVEELTGTQQSMANLPVIQHSWASVYRAGDYHQAHSHPMSAFAGVYCVEAPERELPEGALDFLDPRPNINYYLPKLPVFASDTRSLMLRPGDLVLFPGWLKHFVNPFRGDGIRITISMNFDF